jgi:apolipoprotein N-acyltransferase
VEYFRAEQAPMRFSWLSLGYSQQNALGWALSPLIGVYGIGFLLAAWAAAFAALWPGRRGSPKTRFGLWTLALMPALSLVPRPAWKGETLGTAWLQQSRDQDMAPKAPDAEGIAADLVVWPEYSLFDSPFTPGTSWFLEEAKKAAAKSRRGLLFGAEDFPEGGPKARNDFFNTAFLLDPAGQVAGKAVKNQPVQLIMDGHPAQDVAVMDLPGEGPPLRLGAGVCYDGSYQNFSRKMALRGADILCFPTFNKADWGPVQHRQHQRMFQSRAMEHRLPVLVAANSGPTFAAWPGGEVAAEIPGGTSEGLLAPIGRSPGGAPTLFARGGWLIGPGLQGLFALGLGFAWREARRAPAGGAPSNA